LSSLSPNLAQLLFGLLGFQNQSPMEGLQIAQPGMPKLSPNKEALSLPVVSIDLDDSYRSQEEICDQSTYGPYVLKSDASDVTIGDLQILQAKLAEKGIQFTNNGSKFYAIVSSSLPLQMWIHGEASITAFFDRAKM